jgi:hypothetical protein
VMTVYPFDPPKSILKKDVEHFKEDDSWEDPHSLTERPSSPSIEFKPLPAGPHDAKPLEKENP